MLVTAAPRPELVPVPVEAVFESDTGVVELMLVPDAAAEDVLLTLEAELEVDTVGLRGFTRLSNKPPVVPAALELDPVVEPVDESSPLNISDNERVNNERVDDEEDVSDDDDVINSVEEVSGALLEVIVELTYIARLICRGK